MGKMMNFKNSWLAEPFEEQVSSLLVSDIREMGKAANAAQPGIVPSWVQLVIASADVQMEGNLCFYVVRGFGEDYRSVLIDFGRTNGIEDLKRILNKIYPGETQDIQPYGVDLMMIDAKYMPNRVYQFASTDARINACIGSNVFNLTPTIRTAVGHRQLELERREFNTNYYKDQLEDRRKDGRWLVNSGITDEYCQHMSSEHKIIDPKTGRLVWMQRSQGGANHLYDCEVMCQVGADIAGVNLLASQNAAPEFEEEEAIEMVLGI